jgi:hypothetical protein
MAIPGFVTMNRRRRRGMAFERTEMSGPFRCPRWLPVVAAALAATTLGSPLRAVSDRPLKSVVADLKDASVTDFTFVVSGDNRPAGKGAPQPRITGTIFDEIALLRPAFVLWSGDAIYGYCDSAAEIEAEYDVFLSYARRGQVPLFNAPGNHDVHAEEECAGTPKVCGRKCTEDAFTRRFGQLYGSFDYAGVHFISLDSEVAGQENGILGEQLAWLQQDLEKNKGARAIFIFDHCEFHSSPLIDDEPGKDHPAISNRAALHDLFRRYPVKAVFSGHEHLYWHEPAEQHDYIDYFVAGGAGAPVYAPPEKGGFTHYVVVRVAGAKIAYDVVEPGRLYVEPPKVTGPGEAQFWILTGGHIGHFDLGGVEVDLPAAVGACADLTVSAGYPRGDGTLRAVPTRILSCTPGKDGGNHLVMYARDLLAGRSVPVTVRGKAPATPGAR